MTPRMSGLLVAAIKMAPQSEWKLFFDTLAAETAMQIENSPTTELASLQAQVKQIRVLQSILLSEHQR